MMNVYTVTHFILAIRPPPPIPPVYPTLITLNLFDSLGFCLVSNLLCF